MSSNNLYGQLIDVKQKVQQQIAKQQNITLSETSSARSSYHEKVMDEFSLKINQVKQKINIIKENNMQILAFKDKLASNTIPAKETCISLFLSILELHQHLQNLCDANYEQIISLKLDLEVVGTIAKQAMAENPDEPETYSKMYYRQYLTSQVEKIVRESHKIQKIIQKYSVNTSLKRIRALAPQLEEDQALQIAKKRNGFDQIVMAKTMGKASLKLKYRVNDILEKHQGILNLQKSVEQNLRLMNEVAFLVKQQGEMIDSIYDNIVQAKDYVEKAEQVLAKEKKHVKKSRKKMCCIILVGIIVLALIITPIVLKIVNSNK